MKYIKRRSRTECTIDVLVAINNPETNGLKTRVMSKANLSWKLLNPILEDLLNKELIEEADPPRTGNLSSNKDKRTKCTFKLTDKGKQVAQSDRILKELLGEC